MKSEETGERIPDQLGCNRKNSRTDIGMMAVQESKGFKQSQRS